MKGAADGVCAALLALMIACTATGGTPTGDRAPTPRQRPNVLMIVTDDQRAEGALRTMPQTKRLFGKQGTRFSRAFATTPVCCPSRASIMTGLYAHNHNVRQNPMGYELDQRSTIQYHLKRAGYRTGAFGKYLQGLDIAFDPPYFDRWSIFRNSKFSYYDGDWNVQGTVTKVPDYSTSYISARALEFLDETEARDDRPWFLFVAPSAPHPPFTAEPSYARATVPSWSRNPSIRERNRSDKPPHVRAQLPARKREGLIRRRQLRTLMSVDDLVADVMRAVREQGETRRTLALFLSDNGFMWGDHGLRSKFHPYTASIRIPMLMRWPGRIPQGERDNRIAATIDVAPTILRAAGLNGPARDMDGRSLLGRETRRALLLEKWKTKVPKWASLRTRSYQYIEYYKNGKVTFKELYRLERDPWQTTNVLGDRRRANDPSDRRLRRLHRRLQRARRCSSACP